MNEVIDGISKKIQNTPENLYKMAKEA